MFQQRHFEAIAQMMQETFPNEGDHGLTEYYTVRRDQWFTTRNAMEILFLRHNPRFNISRFEIACMPGANVKARKAA